jgi:hypothetical protein
MPTDNAATTNSSTSNGTLSCDDSDDDDPDEASHPISSPSGDNTSQDESTELNRSSTWIVGSRLIRKIRASLLSEEDLKTNRRW